jgi:hypothetical protein
MLQLTAAESSKVLVTYNNVDLFTKQTERISLIMVELYLCYRKDFVQFTVVNFGSMEFIVL